MIVPDVNVLVYAFRVEAERHDEYVQWLSDVRSGTEGLGLVEDVLTGFLRVVTNPRIFSDPAPNLVALQFVDGLRATPRAALLVPSTDAWSRFRTFIEQDRQVRGNLIPDAYLAAATIAHGARLATADRGLARFPGLDWFHPLSP